MSKVFSFLVLAFLLFVASDATNKIVNISEICKKTTNPPLCLDAFNSSTIGKDLVSLSQVSIETVRALLLGVVFELKTYVPVSPVGPKAKAHYKKCLELFGEEGALSDIYDSEQALKMKDYLDMVVHANAVSDRIRVCVSGLSPGEPLFPIPDLLPGYSQSLEAIKLMISIIHIISNDLMRGY
ncbi:pectinesterase inhibitor-like [Lotus japonicus]|uniref:pectinesterase inhibitor-like n=1 Tax=Lotus japonicus TaxID=34305 RepID=UPI00258A10E2|nr:pectinesterase inhibitor-like [Lotus japonicus]